MIQLPTLDFSKFLHGTEEEQLELGEALVASFEHHGFVKLVNHGIPETTVKEYLKGTKALFDLPLGAKGKIENDNGPNPQRGWSHKGAEVTAKLSRDNIKEGNGDDLKDEREFFDAGPATDKQYTNKWPTEDLPGFQPLMERCYNHLQDASLQIVEAMEVGLKLERGTLVDRCIPAASEIRLNHYPPVSMATLREGKVRRTWPHTDFGIITLLFQDTVGGLELEDRTKPRTFVPVTPGDPDAPTELVVNISNTFQRWTNDRIRAGLHQVNVPEEMKDQIEGICPDRYSSIFFFKADRNQSVGPLPAFVSSQTPALYKDITALQYQQQMTKILY
ncbi:MAG: electron carrier [Chaenotheca gracillima]|nr:MAG: electron carrier [Chaenotheca gracillima]